VVSKIQAAYNHDDILFFTNLGRVFRQKIYEIPLASKIAKGTPVVNLIQLSPDEKATSWLTVSHYKPEDFLVMVTAKGFIKKTSIKAYENIRSSGLIAVKLDKEDGLCWVRYARPGDEVVITTQDGQAIRFKESEARPMGRAARGVRGIKLRPGDEVVGADVVSPGSQAGAGVLVLAEKGLGKRTALSAYTLQHRGGVGVKTVKITDRTGKLKGARAVADPKADLIVTSSKGQVIRTPLRSIPVLSRATQGVKVIRLAEGDKVASFTIISQSEERGEIEAERPTTRRELPPKAGKGPEIKKIPAQLEAGVAKPIPTLPKKIGLPSKIKISRYPVGRKTDRKKPKETTRAGFRIRTIKAKTKIGTKTKTRSSRLKTKTKRTKSIFRVRKLGQKRRGKK